MKHHHHHHHQLFSLITFLSQVILIVRGSYIELKKLKTHPLVSFLEFKNCNYQGVDVLAMKKEVAFALFGSKKVATM